MIKALKSIFFYLGIPFILGITSCTTIKYVPDDSYLLSKVKIDIDEKEINEKEIKRYIQQTPNKKILGFWKFGLGLYNMSSKKRDEKRDNTKKEVWLRRVGEAPVIYDSYMVERSVAELSQYMRNKGYYEADISDTTIFKKKNKRSAVYYSITANTPHKIKSFEYVVKDDSLKNIADKSFPQRLPKINKNFDMDVLAEERERLLNDIRDGGFYRMTRERLHYEADTTAKDRHSVNLKLILDKEVSIDSLKSEEFKNHEKYTIRNYRYETDYSLDKYLSSDTTKIISNPDTVKIDNHIFLYNGGVKVKPNVLINANHIKNNTFYNVTLVKRTYNELLSLRLFKMVNIYFEEIGENDSLGNPMLDCVIQLTLAAKQSYSFDIEGTNSSGNFGVAGNLNYHHKNLFKGAEILHIKLKGAVERQTYGTKDSIQLFNTSELGTDITITVPKFLIPVKSTKTFKYSTPKTLFSTSFNYQKRPDYTRTIAGLKYGYSWKTSEYLTHLFTPVDFNIVKVFEMDSSFNESIENLYIKSSYQDHTIPALNYYFIYNTQRFNMLSNYAYLRGTIETSGNVFYLCSKLVNGPKYPADEFSGEQYHFLGTPFAQYVKADIEHRFGWYLDKSNMIVFRSFGGIAVPYGNSNQIPFEKKYFTGGANGIRAWPVRTLGPGTYKAEAGEFPNQSGDIKLEFNAEYRYKLLSFMEGAFFIDVGNIWSLNDNRDGANFKLNRFFDELAVGSGVGLRLDFSYVVLRLDLGVKLRDPGVLSGSQWIPWKRSYTSNDFNLSFAIGYPF